MEKHATNRVLRELGFDAKDRVVVIHADDLGMCGATIDAFAELVDYGLVSSGSVMVPCPWFPAMAAWCRSHPSVDVGVHLTLNSEWEGYRWGPVSTRDRATGLLDRDGYFHRDRQPLWENADPKAVAGEMRAQLALALAAGVDVSHVDTHMFSAFHPVLLRRYVDLAVEHNIPPFVSRDATTEWVRALGANRVITELETSGYPIFDYVCLLGLDHPPSERLERTRKAFDAMPPGLSCFLLHPSCGTPELRAILPDWKFRIADYEVFLKPELRNHLRRIGIQIISYRTLRGAVRGPRRRRRQERTADARSQ